MHKMELTGPTIILKSHQKSHQHQQKQKNHHHSAMKAVEEEEEEIFARRSSGESGGGGGGGGSGGGGHQKEYNNNNIKRKSGHQRSQSNYNYSHHRRQPNSMEEEELKGWGWLEVIDRSLKEQFYNLGVCIGKSPTYFIIIPIFISLLLGTGMQRLTYVDDPEYLFSPVDGEAKHERTLIDTYFRMNYSSKFNPSRFVRPGRFARVFIVAQDGGTLLRNHVWKEINALDDLIHSVKITHDEDEYTYDTLCARWEEDCYENDVLELGEIMDQIEVGNVSLTYPVMLNPTSFKTYAFPFFFGGATISNVSTVTSVKALQANYFINVNTPKNELRGEKWERAVLDALDEADAGWKHIKVARFTVRTLAEELEKNTFSVIPYFSVTVLMMILFTVGTCMMADWVKSKPWLGIVGVISSTLGSLAAFGLVCYCGVVFIGINMAAPFLMLGIGIDDTFVMLASWRRTSVHDPVPKRMGEAYAEAAVSITITSITDMLSFWVGVITPFPCVKIFSIYSGAAVVATYLWHIFFFGGAIALSGYHEAENRHSFYWCLKTTPKSKAANKPWLYRLFCTGGIDPDDPYHPKDNKEHGIMVFFRDYWGAFLNLTPVKIIVLALFIAYLGVACWGITKTQEGLERRKLARYDSYAVTFFDMEDLYFREFPYRIQVVVTGDVEYSNQTIQRQIESMMQQFEKSEYVDGGSLYTESWLRAFLGFVERSKLVEVDYNITTETDFIDTLQENYLGPSSVFSEDIKFNKDNNKIIASRFIIQTVNISDSNEERDMAAALRAIAKEQGPGLNVTVFHPFFVFFDQFLLIRNTSIQCVSIAALIMMAVSLVFIPNPLCSLWVAFSILSIEAGVVGFMTLWNVNLDAISMINLIMCIGFSVDFSAHISYAYMSAKVDTPDERVKSCLYSLGLPIVQGAVSTILGVIALLVAPSYIFITFFKVVFLVIFIAAMHGLFLLPVLLSLFGPGSCKAVCSSGDSIEISEHDRKKDKVVPYSFVVTPAGLDPKNYQVGLNGEKRRGSAQFQPTGFMTASQVNGFGLQGGQFVNGGVIPRVQGLKSGGSGGGGGGGGVGSGNSSGQVITTQVVGGNGKSASASPPSRNSLERDLGLGTSGEDESSESSLSKKNKNKIVKSHMKEMYSNEGYLSDDEDGGGGGGGGGEGGGGVRKLSTVSNHLNSTSNLNNNNNVSSSSSSHHKSNQVGSSSSSSQFNSSSNNNNNNNGRLRSSSLPHSGTLPPGSGSGVGGGGNNSNGLQDDVRTNSRRKNSQPQRGSYVSEMRFP